VQLEGPVRVTLRIFYASERPDLDESVMLDVLQDRYRQGRARELVQKGVYRNDRQVREKHVFHAIDRTNPRAEIEVEPLRRSRQAMGDHRVTMTADQAGKLRVLMQEAFDQVLGRRINFALAIKDDGYLDVISSMGSREDISDLFKRAMLIVRTPPDDQIAIPDHRATGESPTAHEAGGMAECGHAAPQAFASSSSSSGAEPAGAAVSERCWRRIPPDFAEQCPHDATGGIRLKLYPALAIQKRYGKRDRTRSRRP
jgi:hypothetical protein